MPSVTVIMPVFNAMPYLPQAVESIRRQTFTDWVFVIVDDGSTDGSAEYLRELDDPRIRVLHQSHQGPAVASNRALELGETEFIARMDADDISHRDRLAEQVAFLRSHPQVGLLGTQIEPLGSARTGRRSSLATDHATICNDLMRGRHAMCNPTIMCRTALLRQIGGYRPDGALEDWSMFLDMAEKAEVANLDRPLLSYRIHGRSTNGRHMAELRARIAFVCQRATDRRAGRPETTYEQFMAARRAAPIGQRAEQWLEGYAMAQYRTAMADILGARRVLGYARLAWAAACSPRLTVQRVTRVLRKHRPAHAVGGISAGECLSVGVISDGGCSSVGGDSVGDCLLGATANVGWASPTIGPNSQRLCGECSPLQKVGKAHPTNGGSVGDGPVVAELAARPSLRWPRKYDLFGVQTSATNYAEACNVILQAAKQQTPAIVSLHAVHAIVSASDDPELRRAVNTFQIVATDGQPVRWAMNLLHKTGLRDRVYGPELMLRLCRQAATEDVPIYLYGGTPESLEALEKNLRTMFPRLRIAGSESPPFHALSKQEEDEAIGRINASEAGIVFIGLGCPKQDFFAYRHRLRIKGVQVCVGAAFDFHAGCKKMAPGWMQRAGLEWFYRLCQEPRRLGRRYLVTNSLFLAKLTMALLRRAAWNRHADPQPQEAR